MLHWSSRAADQVDRQAAYNRF